ncbi:MAG: hypothetical protein WCK51_14655 [Armatimonadota bacterium]
MAITAIALLLASSGRQDGMIELGRKFVAGEKLVYVTKAEITDEQRSGDLQTFIPHDESYSYRHTLDVQKVKADGIAELLYTRPTMLVTLGDTAEAAAKTTTQKLDWKLQMDVSPVNEVLEMKDLTPKKADAPKKNDGVQWLRSKGIQGSEADGTAVGLLFSFVGEVQRLAFFIGGFDTSLDISPRMPFEEIKVGDTWQRTVSATPQKLKGQGDKMGVQRLDYTYTYKGITKSTEGKEIHRIEAVVKLDTDMAEFARQLTKSSKSSTSLKTVPLKFDAKVKYDLDLKTMHLLKAAAESSGSFAIEVKGVYQPLLEDRFRGRTLVKLESWTKPGDAKPSTAKPGTKSTTKPGKKGGG